MKPTRREVYEHFVETLRSLDEDQEMDDVSEETLLIGNMNWRSVEIVYLANQMQEHYGQQFPFNDLFQKVAGRDDQDISIGEWVDFVHQNLGVDAAGGTGGE